jgi:hypothetical protein
MDNERSDDVYDYDEGDSDEDYDQDAFKTQGQYEDQDQYDSDQDDQDREPDADAQFDHEEDGTVVDDTHPEEPFDRDDSHQEDLYEYAGETVAQQDPIDWEQKYENTDVQDNRGFHNERYHFQSLHDAGGTSWHVDLNGVRNGSRADTLATAVIPTPRRTSP